MATTLAIAVALSGAAKEKPAAKPPAPAPAHETEEKKAAVAQVEGIEIARPGGGFLGLQVVDNHFVLTFYTAQKTKTAADAVRATLRWPVKYQPNDERVVLNPAADGTALTSTKTVRPPHTFKVYLSLFASDADAAMETYVVDYHD